MDIKTLREKVRYIDQDIVRLISERLGITRQIGEEKRKADIPLRNWEVEKEVIDNAIRMAGERGVSEDLVKAVMHHVLVESRIQQEMIHYSASADDRENILVIGGLGDMGQWFCYFFQNQGHRVRIYDIKGTSQEFESYPDLKEALKETTYALIATPLDDVGVTIDAIRALDYQGVVFDIASLKGHIQNAIEDALGHGVAIASIHPLFGPAARTLSDKVICICDCGHPTATTDARKLFQNTAASLVTMSLEEHDRLISYILGLSHLVNIVFVRALMSGGYPYKELQQFASTTFLSQMKTARSVMEENPALYYTIQRLNPFKEDLYDALKSAMQEIVGCILRGDGASFIEIMEHGEQWLNAE